MIMSVSREAPVLHDIAVDAAIWGTPIVSFDAMRQAFFRDAGAKYGDVVYYSRFSDWKLQLTTPNASTRYVYLNFNTKAGAVVLEIPAAAGAGLFGSILNAWHVPLADVGPDGTDQGRGAKYLLLPPDYNGDYPPGYITLRSATYNGYAVLRAISENSSKEAVGRALSLIRQIRMYPLARVTSPGATRTIDMSGKLFDGVVRFSEMFFTGLARMIEEEPVQAHDASIIERLKDIGIEKGKPFTPGTSLRRELKAAAQEVLAHFVERLPHEGAQFFAGSKWRTGSTTGSETAFTFRKGAKLDVDARALAFFTACAPPRKLGQATMSLAAYVDGDNRRLSGNNSYRLRLPPNVPAQQFWAVTVYDAESCAFLRDSPKVEVNSCHEALQTNPDGSTYIYFGIASPPGKSANWIALTPGRKWFALLRFYGPKPALFDKSWRAPDIERVS